MAADSSAAIKAKVNTLVFECVQKAAGIVLQSRGCAEGPRDRGERSWFQLNIENVEGLRKALGPWESCPHEPLQIDILAESDTSEVPILLERWLINYQQRKEGGRDTRITTTPKKMGIFLRSLYSYARLLPAFQDPSSRRRHSPQMTYRIYNPDRQPELARLGFPSEDAASYSFPPVATPLGHLLLHARYITKLPFKIHPPAERGPAAIQRDVMIIQDYIPDYNTRAHARLPTAPRTQGPPNVQPQRLSPHESPRPQYFAGNLVHPLTRRHSSPIAIPAPDPPPMQVQAPAQRQRGSLRSTPIPIAIPENEELKHGLAHTNIHTHTRAHTHTHAYAHMQRGAEEVSVPRLQSKSLDSPAAPLHYYAHARALAHPHTHAHTPPATPAMPSTSPMQAPYGLTLSRAPSITRQLSEGAQPLHELNDAAEALQRCSPPFDPCEVTLMSTSPQTSQPPSTLLGLGANWRGHGKQSASSNTQTQAHLSQLQGQAATGDAEPKRQVLSVNIMELPEDPFKTLDNIDETSGGTPFVWEAYINSENDDHQEEPLPFAAEDLVFSDAGDTSSAYSTNVGLLLAHQCETAPILRSFMESTAQTSEEDMSRLDDQLEGFRAYRNKLKAH